MYLNTPDPKAMGLLSSSAAMPLDAQPNMEGALHLLEEHANKLDTTKVGWHSEHVLQTLRTYNYSANRHGRPSLAMMHM